MLEELRRYENLGTPAYFGELFEQLKHADSWTEKSVSEYFYDRAIDGKVIFDGCMPLLKLAGIVSVNQNGLVKMAHGYENILYSETLCQNKLLEGFLHAFRGDDEFCDIFAKGKTSYDFVYRCINVDSSAFSLKYSNIRNLLLDFGFFEPHPDFSDRILIISSRWKSLSKKCLVLPSEKERSV